MNAEEARLYSQCHEPYESGEDADAAFKEFWEEVYKLRCRLRIANVSVIAKDTVIGLGPVMWDSHCGAECEQESMAAWHFGRASEQRQQMIMRAAEIGGKNSIKQPKKLF